MQDVNKLRWIPWYLTCARQSLVYWAVVDALGRLLSRNNGDEPDAGKAREELLGTRFCEGHLLRVPPGALEEEAADVAPEFRLLFEVLVP